MTKEVKEQINTLEQEMVSPGFWDDKQHAQEKIAQLNKLKSRLASLQKCDKGNAVVTIFAGAGGDDAEDFARMLFDMYQAFAAGRGFSVSILHKHTNDHNGIKNTTFAVEGRGVYGLLKHESGVHRLVRISPFNAKKLRHTSFALVEVIPEFTSKEITISPEDIDIDFSKSSGPGGQNVNKRETAVRITHKPSGVTVSCSSERSQAQNRERAMNVLAGKLYKLQEDKNKKEVGAYQISKDTSAEWGSQIRSYVLHPYKLVKDHRTDTEHKDPDKVLQEGDLDIFITSANEKL